MERSVTTPSPAAADVPRSPRRGRIGRWPFGILMVAALRLLDAFGLAAVVFAGAEGLPLGGAPIFGGDSALAVSLDLVLIILAVAGIVGLLLFRRWGWVLTMVLVGLSLLGDLIRVATGDPAYVSMLLHVAAAFYLNQRSVRALASDRLAAERTGSAGPRP